MLPFELMLHVAGFLPIPTIWKSRRVSGYWKEVMEQGLAQRLLAKRDPLFIHLYLLNSKGGPWFSFSPESIEDFIRVPLLVNRVDLQQKRIEYKAGLFERVHIHHGSIDQPRLYRRNILDRLQWCLKIQIHPKDPRTFISKNKLCTVIAPDTPLDSKGTHGSITTFDMQLVYQTRDEAISETQNALEFSMVAFQCTFSYFFSKIDEDKHVNYGNWSIHSPEKLQLLLKTAQDMGLEWKDKFWGFDLVLHWLTFGDPTMARSVVDFLVEHDTLHSTTQKKEKKRYYRSESIDII